MLVIVVVGVGCGLIKPGAVMLRHQNAAPAVFHSQLLDCQNVRGVGRLMRFDLLSCHNAGADKAGGDEEGGSAYKAVPDAEKWELAAKVVSSWFPLIIAEGKKNRERVVTRRWRTDAPLEN